MRGTHSKYATLHSEKTQGWTGELLTMVSDLRSELNPGTRELASCTDSFVNCSDLFQTIQKIQNASQTLLRSQFLSNRAKNPSEIFRKQDKCTFQKDYFCSCCRELSCSSLARCSASTLLVISCITLMYALNCKMKWRLEGKISVKSVQISIPF